MFEFHNIFVTGILITTITALFCCFENEQKKVAFYVGISSVSIKETEDYMAACVLKYLSRVSEANE